MDDAVTSQLDGIAIIVRSSWSVEDARAAEAQYLGEAYTSVWADKPAPISAIESGEYQRLFSIRAEFEGGCKPTSGLVYQELPRALLAHGIFEPLRPLLVYLKSIVPQIDISTTDKFDALAAAYLTHLAEHQFTSWPQDIREALAPRVCNNSAPVRTAIVNSERSVPSRHARLLAMPISEALGYWQRHRRPGRSAVTEASRGIARFVHLLGDLSVSEIKREHVLEFHDLIMDLPPQIELAKVNAAGKTLPGRRCAM